jgi:hypothetical protein
LDLAPSERSEAEPNLVSGANSYLISFDFWRDSIAVTFLKYDNRTWHSIIDFAFERTQRSVEQLLKLLIYQKLPDVPQNIPVLEASDVEVIQYYEKLKLSSPYINYVGDPFNSTSITTNAQLSIQQLFRAYGIELQTPERLKVATYIKLANEDIWNNKVTYNKNISIPFLTAINNRSYPQNSKRSQDDQLESLLPEHNKFSHYGTSLYYALTRIRVKAKLHQSQKTIKQQFRRKEYQRISAPLPSASHIPEEII